MDGLSRRAVPVQTPGARGAPQTRRREARGRGDRDGKPNSEADTAARQRNVRCTLLPKLLPNAVGRGGKETDRERSGVQDVPTNRGVPGRKGTDRDASLRIWRPVL
jgi:hypothetical protein